ncbi:MAG: hypothetical protein DRO14_00525 [Thermoprotei archaeon]|nr:MAG: hypothetical protein DRO14_00525 [Thermoprotei archaeon]
MSFGHGISSKVYYHTVDLSQYVESVDPTFERDIADIRVLATPWVQRVAGRKAITIALAGVHDPSAGAIGPSVWSIFDGVTGRVFAYLPQGDSLGGVAYCSVNLVSSESITAGDDAVRMPVTVIGSTSADRAEILHTLGEETGTGSEDAGSTVDSGSASANGGGAYLIVTALDGGATLSAKIQHSDNGSDWSDLVAFSDVTSETSEQKVVAAETAVERYIRAAWTLSLGSAATFFIAFGRR